MNTYAPRRPRAGARPSTVYRSGIRKQTDRRRHPGDFAIIGDVHGCWYTLLALIERLGGSNGEPPAGLTLISVGDLHNKGGIVGVDSPEGVASSGAVNVLRWALTEHAAGHLEVLDSNHGRGLVRRIAEGTPARRDRSRSVELTLADLLAQEDATTLVPAVKDFLGNRPPFLRLSAGPTGELVVAHAAAAERLLNADILRRGEYDYHLYTDDEFRWTGPQTVITGHVSVPEPTRLRQPALGGTPVGDVLRIDTCVDEGGGLTAYLPHLDSFVTVPTDPRDLRKT
jgi:hypothetical protein